MLDTLLALTSVVGGASAMSRLMGRHPPPEPKARRPSEILRDSVYKKRLSDYHPDAERVKRWKARKREVRLLLKNYRSMDLGHTIWPGREGHTPYKDLLQSHLKNCIKYCQKCGEWDRWYELVAEWRHRMRKARKLRNGTRQ